MNNSIINNINKLCTQIVLSTFVCEFNQIFLLSFVFTTARIIVEQFNVIIIILKIQLFKFNFLIDLETEKKLNSLCLNELFPMPD